MAVGVDEGEAVVAGGGLEGEVVDVGGGPEVGGVQVPEQLCVGGGVYGLADEAAGGTIQLSGQGQDAALRRIQDSEGGSRRTGV